MGNYFSKMLEAETMPLLENINNDKDGRFNSPLPKKSTKEIIINYLNMIFSHATIWDKFLIFIGIIATVVHGLCFLVFAMVLANLTGPFVQQSIYGYRNETAEFVTSGGNNRTQLLTKPDFLASMKVYSMYYMYISIAIFVFSFLQTFLWEYAAENQCYTIRKKFTFQVFKQNVDWFETDMAQNLCFIMTDAVEKVRDGIGHKCGKILQYIVIIGVLMAFALNKNWKLTMIFLTISPLPAILAYFLDFGRHLASDGATEQELYANASAQASKTLRNLKRTFIFGKERLEIDNYRKTLVKAARFANNKYLIRSFGLGIFVFLLFGSYAVAFKHACSVLEDHSANLDDIYTIFITVTIAVFALGQILPWISIIAAAQGSANTLQKYLYLDGVNLPTTDILDETKSSTNLLVLNGQLKFSEVRFAYPAKKVVKTASKSDMPVDIVTTNQNTEVLKGLDLTIERGKTIGIVGKTKSGKSTIAYLMMRFYDPTSGKFSVDTMNKTDIDVVKNMEIAWFRQNMAIIGNKPPKFLDGTLYDNIRAGQTKSLVSMDKAIEAAKLFGIHDAICKLGDKEYRTDFAEFNKKLKRDEKVKLVIIRALVRNPTWLILDQDVLEDEIKQNINLIKTIKNYRKGSVTVVISKIPELMKETDVLNFIEDGKIVESGNYYELMDKKGKFYEYQMSSQDLGQLSCSTPISILTDLIEPEEDDTTVERIKAEAKQMKINYPGLWKMVYITNYDFQNYSWIWIMAVLGCCISGLIVPAFAYFYTDIFSTFGKISVGLPADSKYWTVALIILAVSAAVGYWMRMLFVQTAGEFMILELRSMFFNSVIARPLTWFKIDKHTPAFLENKLGDGVPVIKKSLKNQFSIALSGFFSIQAGLILTMILEWQLGLYILVCLVIIFMFLIFQILYQRERQRISVCQLDFANLTFNKAIQDIWTTQINSLELFIRQKLTNLIYGSRSEYQISCAIFAFMNSLSEVVIYLIFGGAFWYGVHLIDIGHIDPILFFRMFIVLSFSLMTFAYTLIFVPDYTKAELAFGQIMDLINPNPSQGNDLMELSRIAERKEGPVIWEQPKGIKFDQVQYVPEGQTIVFKSNTFDVPTGSTFMIAGCDEGKTDFFNVLLRFTEIYKGQVLIGENDITTMDMCELRANIGYVPKEPDIFEGTILENIFYGYNRPEGKAEYLTLINQVIEMTKLSEFVSDQQPSGSATIISNDSPYLTEGIKFKISLARALIRDPKILLIDEPTHNIKDADETEILELIKKVKMGRTCIITTSKSSVLAFEGLTDLVGMFNNYHIFEVGAKEVLHSLVFLYVF